MVKESIHQEDTTTLNVFSQNRASKLMKEKQGIERSNRQIHNYNWRFQHSSLINQQTITE